MHVVTEINTSDLQGLRAELLTVADLDTRRTVARNMLQAADVQDDLGAVWHADAMRTVAVGIMQDLRAVAV